MKEFYIASTSKILKKFPFGDTLFKDLSLLQPDSAPSFSVEKLLSLAKRFPQIGLADSMSLDKLREEFQDFLLSPADLPSVSKYKAADGVMRPRVGLYWAEVGRVCTLDGQPRFPLLCKLTAALLSISASNADSERGFSILRKIHTNQRSNLDQSTIVALMAMKYNCDDCCFDQKLSSDLLRKCKQFTSIHVAPHSSSH